MPLSALATPDDAAGYGYSLPSAAAGVLLARASVRVRRAAGQPISVTSVTIREPVDGRRLQLPAPPIVGVDSVQAVADDGTLTTVTGWRLDGDTLLLPDCSASVVEVVYRRGWATVPDGIVELVCQVADRLAQTPQGMAAGLRERSIDDYREVFAAEQMQVAGDLLPGELAALRRELGQTGVWVVSFEK